MIIRHLTCVHCTHGYCMHWKQCTYAHTHAHTQTHTHTHTVNTPGEHAMFVYFLSVLESNRRMQSRAPWEQNATALI